MKCPKCQTENPENLKFCGECGAKLGVGMGSDLVVGMGSDLSNYLR